MQSSQLPPPSNPSGPKRQGPPPRTVGAKPGAKPGPPKPKAPTPFGGKPMVPISSLIQAPAFTDPEGASNEEPIQNGTDVIERGEHETKLNEKVEDGVNVIKQNSDSPLNLDIVKPHEEDVHIGEKADSRLNGELEKKTDHGNVQDIKQPIVSHGLEIEHEDIKANHHKKNEENENIRGAKIEEQDPEESGKPARNQDPEENEVKPPMFKQTSPTKIKEQTVHDFEDNHHELPPQGKSEKNSTTLHAGPFSKAKQGPFGNFRPNDVKEEEDQDDTRDGDQNPSPVVQFGKQDRMSSQEDQRDNETYEKPSMPMFFKPKTLAVSEEVNEPVMRYTSREPEFKREEDISLTLKVKALEIELDKEKREKLAFKSEQDRLLDENASLREQLAEATSKLAAPSSQGADTKDQDLTRKDEEIKRLKSELKSTMEGSRLVTEHSNRVISESTKFKEEAEALILSLEQEKDQLYQKFIAYKKQVQEEYAAKLVALQEREKYLSEKVEEYEKDINRHQTDLKQRAHTIQKLASVNNEVESAVAQWPAFQNVLSQIETHSKLIEEARFQIPSPVKVPVQVQVQKSPIKVQEKKIRPSPPKEEPQHVDIHQIHHDVKENDVIAVIAEPPVQHEQDSPFTENVNVQVEEQVLGIEPHKSVNDDDKVSNTPETRVEDNSQTQEKNEEAQNKFEEPVEPLDNGWGIEEPPLIENDNERQEPQENYGEQHYEQPQPVEEYREEQIDIGYGEPIEQQKAEEYIEQPAEYNYEQPTEQYTEQRENYGEYNYEEPVQQYTEQHYPTEPVEYNQEHTEYREEQPQHAEYYQPHAEYKDEQIHYQEEVVQPLEVNYEEPQVHVEQPEKRDFEEQPPAMQTESVGQVTYSNAFTAVPANRIPQKKKKTKPKKKAAGFKPAPVSYNMPDQPQDLGVEQASHHQNYETPVDQTSYQQNYEAPADQGYYQQNYDAPVDQPSHYNYEAPAVYTQEQGYEQSGWGHDNIDVETEVKPPVEIQAEVEVKPPQAVAFGRTPLQAKKGKQSKVPKPNTRGLNTFSQPWTPPVSTYTEQNNGYYHQEPQQAASEEINMENPPAYTEPAQQEEAQIPSMQSVDSTNEKNDINGHGQPPKKGKVVKSKVIKKKQPATGSIFS